MLSKDRQNFLNSSDLHIFIHVFAPIVLFLPGNKRIESKNFDFATEC